MRALDGRPHADRVDASKLGFPLLTALVFLPAVGAVRHAAHARAPARAASASSATSRASATFGMAVFLLIAVRHQPAQPATSSFETTPGSPALGVRWTLGVDGISLFMVALTALLFPIALLASAEAREAEVVHRSGCCCSRRR